MCVCMYISMYEGPYESQIMLHVHDKRGKGRGRRKDGDGAGVKEFPGMGPHMVTGELSYLILSYTSLLDWTGLDCP